MNYLELLKIELPATQKAVLMAIAIRQGNKKSAHPSIKCLMTDTGLAERSIQLALRALEKSGHILTCSSKGHSSKYSVTKPKEQPPHVVHQTPACGAPQPPHVVHPETGSRNSNRNNRYELSKESGENSKPKEVNFAYNNRDEEKRIQAERERRLRKADSKLSELGFANDLVSMMKLGIRK